MGVDRTILAALETDANSQKQTLEYQSIWASIWISRLVGNGAAGLAKAPIIRLPYPDCPIRPEPPLARVARTKFGQPRVPFCYAGGSQGSVPISAGTLISTSSKPSDEAISLWGV